MPDPVDAGGSPDVQSLKAEIVRLNKIIQTLTDRSESRASVQGSDLGLFQTTIMLQDHVRLRTEELEASLRDKERSSTDSWAPAARDTQTLRRTAALQIQLLELVVQQKDVGELIDTVATLLDMPIVLFDTHGEALCVSRSAAAVRDLPARLWTAYANVQDSPRPLGFVEVADERIYFRDILVMGRVERCARDQSSDV